MTWTGTTVVARSVLRAVLQAPPARGHSPLFHFVISFGLFGLFLVSIVDSSFVPLPIPGITDVMIIVMAARHSNWFLLVAAASAGSAIGGYLSYQVGQRGGMAFLEKHVPQRIFRLVRDWMERHAILSVALPAILPPPMPLSPFVLAAGALNMSKRKFMTTFTISRIARHSIAAVLGLHYGRHILRLWNRIFAEYGTPALVVIWIAILTACAFAFWNIYKTSRSVTAHQGLAPEEKTVV